MATAGRRSSTTSSREMPLDVLPSTRIVRGYRGRARRRGPSRPARPGPLARRRTTTERQGREAGPTHEGQAGQGPRGRPTRAGPRCRAARQGRGAGSRSWKLELEAPPPDLTSLATVLMRVSPTGRCASAPSAALAPWDAAALAPWYAMTSCCNAPSPPCIPRYPPLARAATCLPRPAPRAALPGLRLLAAAASSGRLLMDAVCGVAGTFLGN